MTVKEIPEGAPTPAAGGSGLNPFCTRRQTLIWGGASLAGLSFLNPFLAQGADKPVIIMEKAGGLVVADPVLCVGCGRCELACTEFNDGRAAPSLSQIKIDRNVNFGPQGVPAWRVGHGGFGSGLVVQDLCKQCPHPVPCANICPENAIVVSPKTKARVVDAEKCTGCRVCLRACPWEMISFDPETRKAKKCNLCDGKPKCVEACPAGSLHYIPWRDLTGTIPPRILQTAAIPPERAVSCQECHLPGQAGSIGDAGRNFWSALTGGRPSGIRTGSKWIDLAGAILVPVALGSVVVHAILKRMGRS